MQSGENSSDYPFYFLRGLAVLCDKYHSEAALRTFFDNKLSIFLESSKNHRKSSARCFEVARIALLVNHATIFSSATVLCAWNSSRSDIRRGVYAILRSVPSPSDLRGKVCLILTFEARQLMVTLCSPINLSATRLPG
jgi:hypothetical protein